MERKIIADINMHESRIALLENGEMVEFQTERTQRERLVGNIYKGKVANILPGMQAAFVDIGLNKNAFLYAGDILVDKSDFVFQNDRIIISNDLEKMGISDMLKQGQDIMIQVLKQPGGSKGARVTTHITLPGRRLVLMPTVDHVGVSRKIENENERERLKLIVDRVRPKGMGLIVRTAAEGMQEEDFISEIKFLARLWEKIKERCEKLSAPRLIHSEEGMVFRTVRDMFTPDVSEFVINDREYYDKVLALTSFIAPEMKKRIKFFDEHYDMFEHYGINEKIDKILQRKVWLKSGGYIVVDETEALTSIDVNTGKYVGENDLQDTILNVNVEAANEIAKQIRLRDISGIIIIDFIDMEKEENRNIVLDTLKVALKLDRTKTSVLGITQLGLVEMTRKKVRRKLSILTKKECPLCGGSGFVDSEESVALRLRREVIKNVNETSFNDFIIELHPSVFDFIMAKKNENDVWLPVIPGKKFFLKPIKTLLVHEINICGIAEDRVREELLKESQMFN
ncbi:MAG: Rne/Rng family ribonuclease [Eubacteriales bacterium]